MRWFREQKRYSLTLHVTTHQCTVSIVMLKERNKGSRYRNNLTRRNVHILNILWRTLSIVSTMPARNKFCCKSTVFFQIFTNLSNIVLVFIHCRKVLIFRSCLAAFNFSVRSFKESITIDTSIDCKRNNQTNIRTFRSFNWTHAAIMRIMNITNFKTCTVTRKTSRSQSIKTALMCKFCQRIYLIHELRQLA